MNRTSEDIYKEYNALFDRFGGISFENQQLAGQLLAEYREMHAQEREEAKKVKEARYFESGAYRDQNDDKLDYEGFLSPAVLTRYAEYMHKNRKQSDGNMRDADNWQRGIPRKVYMKSLWRHFMDMWTRHRKGATADDDEMQEVVCSVIFNAMGYLHEMLEGRE